MKGSIASLVVLALVATADAKPLPKGLTIAAKDGKLVATKDGVTVPIYEDYESGSTKAYDSIDKVQLSEDGKSIEISTSPCGMVEDEPRRVPLARIEGRLENYTGMAAHVKKKYADATTHFAAAVAKDPAWPLFVTNLLSAQAMGGKLDDADKTLASYGKVNLAWLGWRLAVDSDLASLKGRASVTTLFPTKATTIDAKHFVDVAVSPLGYVAVRETLLVGMPSNAPDPQDIVIYDRATSAEILRLPVRTAAQTKEAVAALAFMAFTQRATKWTEIPDTGGDYTGVAGDVTVTRTRDSYGCGGMDSRQTVSTISATK